MVRRPYLSKAVLLAGLLWLGIIQAAPPWEQGRTGPPSFLLDILVASPALAAELKQPQKPALESRPAQTTNPSSVTQNPMDNLLRLLAGGLLAGVLWSVLFGYPFYSYWPDKPWPLGLLDLSVLAAFFYLGYLVLTSAFRKNQETPAPPCPAFLKCRDSDPLTLTVDQEAEPGINDIAASDPDFDLAAFGEFAHRVMLNLHAAWNRQDLEALKDEVEEDLLEYLRMGLKIVSLREEISRLEDLHLRRLVVTAAGQEGDKEYITLWLEGEVMDYILQKSSYKLVSGSLTYPIRARESWRFERRRGQKPWKLMDIQDH
jgi:predicted lipid-binding transport protein (Tim44 family)